MVNCFKKFCNLLIISVLCLNSSFAVSNDFLSPPSLVQSIDDISQDITKVLSDSNMFLLNGYSYPLWLAKKIDLFLYDEFKVILSKQLENKRLVYEDVVGIAKNLSGFLISKGGIAFSGEVEDVPIQLRAYLNPKELFLIK